MSASIIHLLALALQEVMQAVGDLRVMDSWEWAKDLGYFLYGLKNKELQPDRKWCKCLLGGHQKKNNPIYGCLKLLACNQKTWGVYYVKDVHKDIIHFMAGVLQEVTHKPVFSVYKSGSHNSSLFIVSKGSLANTGYLCKLAVTERRSCVGMFKWQMHLTLMD